MPNNLLKFFYRLFEEVADEHPDLVAVSYADQKITYAKLNKKANCLARYLRSQGVGKEDVVAVALPRSIDAIISVIAIMKSGAAFSLLSLPSRRGEEIQGIERFNYCLKVLNPSLIISTSYTESFIAVDSSVRDTKRLVVHGTNGDFASLLGDFADTNFSEEEVEQSFSDLAYVTFTSGSTGKPKGVEVEHAGLYSRFLAHDKVIKITAHDVVAQYCRIEIDAAIMEMMLALGSGAQLALVPPERQASYRELVRYYREMKVSIAIFTPTILKELDPSQFSKQLRVVLTTGEEVKSSLLDKWVSPARLVINGYGPAEVTIATSLYSYETGKNVTIGKALDGLHMKVLDRHSYAPLDVGLEGEVYIGGLGVARPYRVHLGMDQTDRARIAALSAERFFDRLPSAGSDISIMRWYKTNDKGMLTKDGEIVITGRFDFQFKKAGRIISPEEIEEQIKSLPGFSEAEVCVFPRGKHHIVVVGIRFTGEIKPAMAYETAQQLLKKIDSHMLPQRWYFTNSSTRVLDWKSDFKGQLIQIPFNELKLASFPSSALPSELTETQAKLLRLWRELLLSSEEQASADFTIKLEDSFGLLGGNSVTYMKLRTRFASLFPGINFPQFGFERKPTIAYLAQYIELMREYSPTISFSEVANDKLPVIFIHPLTGEVVGAYQYLEAQFKDRRCYGLSTRLLTEDNEFSLEEIASDYVRTLTQQLKVTGPCVLVGHSAGGVIAYEMARQLAARGQNVAVVMLDSLSPAFVRSATNSVSQTLVYKMTEALLSSLDMEPLAVESLGFESGWSHEQYLHQAFKVLYEHVGEDCLGVLRAAKQLALAILHYRPKPMQSPLYLYVAEENDWSRLDAYLGWNASSVVKASLEGVNHQEIVRDEEIVALLSHQIRAIADAGSHDQKLYKVSVLHQQQASRLHDLPAYIPLQARRDPREETADSLWDAVKSFMDPENPHRLLLLQGDSGSGKSTFSYFLEMEQWHRRGREESAYIPLRLELKRYQTNTERPEPCDRPSMNCLEQMLSAEYDLTKEEIAYYKTKAVLLILDGYDEMPTAYRFNLYTQNNLQSWSDLKVLVTCRSHYLTRWPVYQDFFKMPLSGGREGFEELYMEPFSVSQVKDYVRQYLTHIGKPEDLPKYERWLATLPGLLELSKSPFLLKLSMRALPILAERYQSLRHPLERLKPIQAIDVYQTFMAEWFNREVTRLMQHWRDERRRDFRRDFQRYAEQLAWEMVKQDVETVSYVPESAAAKATWSAFFNASDAASTISKLGCPLSRIGEDHYRFTHRGFLEYFAASYLWSLGLLAVISEKDRESLAEAYKIRLLIKEQGVLGLLAQHFKRHAVEAEKVAAIYFELIAQTKALKSTSLGANAITVLNQAGISLVNQDFSETDLSGADLTGANLAFADFTRAILNSVILQQTNLPGVKFNQAFMEGVDFGQKAPLVLGNRMSKVKSILLYQDRAIIGLEAPYMLSTISLQSGEGGETSFSKSTWSLQDLKLSEDNVWLAVAGNFHRELNVKKFILFAPNILYSVLKYAISPRRSITRLVQDIDFFDEPIQLKLWKSSDVLKGEPDRFRNFMLDDWLWNSQICTSLAISSELNHLSSGSRAGIVDIWDIADQNHFQRIKISQHEISALLYIPNQSLLVIIHNMLQVWKFNGIEYGLSEKYPFSMDKVSVAKYIKEKKSLVVSDKSGLINIWAYQRDEFSENFVIQDILKTSYGSITDFVYEDESDTIYMASSEGVIFSWKLARPSIVKLLAKQIYPIRAIALDFIRGEILAGGDSYFIHRYSQLSNSALQKFSTDLYRYDQVLINEDAQWLFALSQQKIIQIWNLKSRLLYKTIAVQYPIIRISISPDCVHLAAICENSDTLCVWNLNKDLFSSHPLLHIRFDYPIVALRFSDHSEKIALIIGSEIVSISLSDTRQSDYSTEIYKDIFHRYLYTSSVGLNAVTLLIKGFGDARRIGAQNNHIGGIVNFIHIAYQGLSSFVFILMNPSEQFSAMGLSATYTVIDGLLPSLGYLRAFFAVSSINLFQGQMVKLYGSHTKKYAATDIQFIHDRAYVLDGNIFNELRIVNKDDKSITRMARHSAPITKFKLNHGRNFLVSGDENGVIFFYKKDSSSGEFNFERKLSFVLSADSVLYNEIDLFYNSFIPGFIVLPFFARLDFLDDTTLFMVRFAGAFSRYKMAASFFSKLMSLSFKDQVAGIFYNKLQAVSSLITYFFPLEPVMHNSITAFGFSADDLLLAIASSDGLVKVLDLESYRVKCEFYPHDNVLDLCFSSSDELTTAGKDGIIKTWKFYERLDGSLSPLLVWSSFPALEAESADLTGVHGLSWENYELLKAYGAKQDSPDAQSENSDDDSSSNDDDNYHTIKVVPVLLGPKELPAFRYLTDDYVVYFLPKEDQAERSVDFYGTKEGPQQPEFYPKESCHLISFFGHRAARCEGQSTSVVLVERPKAAELVNFVRHIDGHLVILFMFLLAFKYLYSRLTGSVDMESADNIPLRDARFFRNFEANEEPIIERDVAYADAVSFKVVFK